MWVIFIAIFLALFLIGISAYLIFSKVNNYIKIQNIKTENEIKKLKKEREEN